MIKEPGTKARLPGRGFSREALEALSADRGEPEWVRERRLKAWRHYQELEPPFWRRTDVGKLGWEELVPYAPPQAALDGLEALPPKLHRALATYGRRAGLLLQRDSASVHLDLDEDLRAQGVIWADLHTAARDHAELVSRFFMEDAVPITTDR